MISALVLSLFLNHSRRMANFQHVLQSRTFANEVLMNIFDRKAKLLQKERQAKLIENHVFDYLKEEVSFTF